MSNHYWDFPIVTAVCGLAGGMRSWLSSVWCTYDADDALSVYVCVCVVWQVAWLSWVVCVYVCVCGPAGGMAHMGGQQVHVWGAGGQRLVGDILPNVVLPHQNQDPRQLAGNSHNCHITISSSH